ncbi:MAG TPA: glycoside hydrolase family 99-like domain-containing protein [Candidatus Hydrogenedentes bacterium]|nr:glycoside hydrolase family 99-like domain-containing protein [Candidatus Hydrogenedentota bacterium]
MVTLCVLLALTGIAGECRTLQEWTFESQTDCEAWLANAYLAEVSCKDSILKGRTIDWDPFFTCSGLNLPARPGQVVRLRLRATSGGQGQFFWTGQTTGQYGGFAQKKSTDFTVRGQDIEDIYLLPCWHREETIRQLRLDLYDGAAFEIDSIAIVEPSAAVKSEPSLRWDFTADAEASEWSSLNGGRLLLAPPLSIPTEDLGWASVTLRASGDTRIGLHWTTSTMTGSRHETLYLSGDGAARCRHIELQAAPGWEGRLAGIYLDIPEPEKVTVERILLGAEPEGPPELEAAYFGFENAVSRPGRPESVLAQVVNRGAAKALTGALRLEVPEGVSLLEGPMFQEREGLLHGETTEVRWMVQAAAPVACRAVLYDADVELAAAEIAFAPPLSVDATYVPEPLPLQTSHNIMAYYFPGWNVPEKWDCIRNTAPIRRPLLGYYDEGNPECVDWQVKWAVENGISCFLVDWYWSAGNQHLQHWFDAYRKARYRDLLKVAIMWANHNAPGTHSRDDWRNVTREWIDNYFTLDSYYQVDGKPVVYIWAAGNIRRDLGGSTEVAAAFIESQEMARAAGYEGIVFISLRHDMTEHEIALLAEEGYDGQTSYHEWGDALSMAPAPTQGRYDDMVTTVAEAWEKRRVVSGPLHYTPVVDTGWDSRPWHGPNATAFHGRTVAGFKKMLEGARAYCDRHGEKEIILGPVNEWGEGSYIEPNLEFGFGMYEAIRDVFGQGKPEEWPQNFGPRDAGLGPYDFPVVTPSFRWNFDEDADGWAAFMGIDQYRAEGGNLCFKTTNVDPALTRSTKELRAARYGKLRIRMQVTGDAPERAAAQLFWTIGAGKTLEAQSHSFALERDGAVHEYVLDLDAHPRWRGTVTSLRFDPCNFSGAEVRIEEITFNRQ